MSAPSFFRLKYVLASTLFAMALLCGGSAKAQFSSEITGRVTDPFGAAVLNAKLVLTNTSTGVKTDAVSNSDGYYHFPALTVGTYTVMATAPGFDPVVVSNVELTGMKIREISISFAKVSVVESTVEVQATSAALDTTESQISTDISEPEIRNLPIEGRNVFTFTGQAPGVLGEGLMGREVDIFNTTITPVVAANGAPNYENLYLLDSFSLLDSPSAASSKLIPNPDSIAEVVVSTSNYSAQFGQGGGLVTQLTSKSGTDKWHGSVFENHQDNDLTARNWFQNVPDPITGRYFPADRRNEFGGSVGGPIVKNHTYIFGSYDGLRSTQSNANLTVVDTPQWDAFMKANYPNAISTQMLTTYPYRASGLTNFQTVAYREANEYLAGTLCAAPGATVGPLGMHCDMPMLATATQTNTPFRNGNQYNVRVDQNFRDSRDKLYGNFYKTLNSYTNVQYARPAFNAPANQAATFAGATYVHIFSPSMVNEVGMGYTRIAADNPCYQCQVPLLLTGSLAALFGDTFGQLSPFIFAQNDFEFRDTLHFDKGKHAVAAGVEIFHHQDFAHFSDAYARNTAYGYDNIFDFAADHADQQYGIWYNPQTGGAPIANYYHLNTFYGYFVQDDWKVLPALTVNVGLRYQYGSNPSEKFNHMSELQFGNQTTLRDRIANVSVGPALHPFTSTPRTNFSPRLGFSWRPFNSQVWVVRGAFGVFYDLGGSDVWGDTASGNPPFLAQATANIHVPSGPQPTYGLCTSATPPYGCKLPAVTAGAFNSHGGPQGIQVAIGGPDPTLKMPYTSNAFFGVQRLIGHDMIAEVDYTHSTGIDLLSIINRDRYDGAVNRSNQNVNYLNPYFNAINYADNSNHSNYDAGTAFLRKTFSKGYSFQVSYTYGKTLDVMSGTIGTAKGSENAGVIDVWNLKAQHGLSDMNIRHQVTFNGVWTIPSPKFSNAFLTTAAKGWVFSGMGVLHSGVPATVFTTSETHDFNLDGNGYDLPNVPSFGRKRSASRSQYLHGTVFPGAAGAQQKADFPLPVDGNGQPTGVEGNLGRNTYTAPGFAEIDSTLSKDTRIPWFRHNAAMLRITLNAYNLFNRVNISNWDTDLDDLNFGLAQGALQPRTLELGAKITF